MEFMLCFDTSMCSSSHSRRYVPQIESRSCGARQLLVGGAKLCTREESTLVGATRSHTIPI